MGTHFVSEGLSDQKSFRIDICRGLSAEALKPVHQTTIVCLQKNLGPRPLRLTSRGSTGFLWISWGAKVAGGGGGCL